jgi:hypothetical protein
VHPEAAIQEMTDNEKREIFKFIEADKPLPEKYRFLLFDDKREIIRQKNEVTDGTEEYWTGDFIFENEWQSFRTKKDRSLDLKTPFHECAKGRYKIAVKVVDIFGNDTMTIIEVGV